MTFCFLKRLHPKTVISDMALSYVNILPCNWVCKQLFQISDSLSVWPHRHCSKFFLVHEVRRPHLTCYSAIEELISCHITERERGKEVEKRSHKVAIMLQHKCLFITDCFTRSSSTNCQSLLFVIVLSLCCYAVAPVIPFQSPARTHNSTSPPVPPLCLPLLAPNSTNKVTFFLYLANYFLLIGYSSWNRNP